MTCRLRAAPLALAAGLILASSASTRAQTYQAPTLTQQRQPYVNPLMNPALVPPGMQREAALLQLMQLNEARGGIGSGLLGGPWAQRPQPRASQAMPQGASRPGSRASSYFLRGPGDRPLQGSVYRRHDRYFSKNPYGRDDSP